MISIITSSRAFVFAALLLPLGAVAAFAQNYEEQAKTILQIFESGQKDSAYALIEPLKRSARFVPAVLYARAQMTPDDRALGLYKELIALEPGGPWADRAAWQLVRRYSEKGDSVAAHTWQSVIKVNYPRSPYVAQSEDLLKSIQTWQDIDDGVAERPRESEPAKAKPTGKSTTPAKGTTPAKPTSSTSKTAKPTKPATTAADTYKSSGMRGFALQVGLYPTRDEANARATALKKKKLTAVSLPKLVDGKKQYAVVVGPYNSIETATQKKSSIAGICDCQAFIVKVE